MATEEYSRGGANYTGVYKYADDWLPSTTEDFAITQKSGTDLSGINPYDPAFVVKMQTSAVGKEVTGELDYIEDLLKRSVITNIEEGRTAQEDFSPSTVPMDLNNLLVHYSAPLVNVTPVTRILTVQNAGFYDVDLGAYSSDTENFGSMSCRSKPVGAEVDLSLLTLNSALVGNAGALTGVIALGERVSVQRVEFATL